MDTDEVLEVIETETKENIENLLRYYECDDSILVDSIKCMAGSRDGDNYMSVVKRVLVKGRQNNNQSGECTLRILCFPRSTEFVLENKTTHPIILTHTSINVSTTTTVTVAAAERTYSKKFVVLLAKLPK